MNITKINQRNILTADEGKMLTNGEIYVSQIILANGVDPSTFYEITDEEYAQILEALNNE